VERFHPKKKAMPQHFPNFSNFVWFQEIGEIFQIFVNPFLICKKKVNLQKNFNFVDSKVW
jgi:hypothetical protein